MCCNGFRILIMFLFTFSSFALNIFMPNIPVIVWYFGSINIFTLILFGIDKLNSTKERKRVPELSFHFFSLIGGIIGVLLGILIFRHKLRSKYFLLIQFIILLLWILAIFFIFKNIDAIISWGQSFSG
ncbi:MAG: DUF1294 domain-containing protein [Campylobacteraceae bacterium]|nr:DUF1294 domain-containing protein [Campylobacteraceae bacterium]